MVACCTDPFPRISHYHGTTFIYKRWLCIPQCPVSKCWQSSIRPLRGDQANPGKSWVSRESCIVFSAVHDCKICVVSIAVCMGIYQTHCIWDQYEPFTSRRWVCWGMQFKKTYLSICVTDIGKNCPIAKLSYGWHF